MHFRFYLRQGQGEPLPSSSSDTACRKETSVAPCTHLRAESILLPSLFQVLGFLSNEWKRNIWMTLCLIYNFSVFTLPFHSFLLDSCMNFQCKRGHTCEADQQGKPHCVCQDPETCPPAKVLDQVSIRHKSPQDRNSLQFNLFLSGCTVYLIFEVILSGNIPEKSKYFDYAMKKINTRVEERAQQVKPSVQA